MKDVLSSLPVNQHSDMDVIGVQNRWDPNWGHEQWRRAKKILKSGWKTRQDHICSFGRI